MQILPVLEFIWGKIAYFWSFLFTVETPFAMSLGSLMFGCLVAGIVINFLVSILIPRTSDIVEGGNIYRQSKIQAQREAQREDYLYRIAQKGSWKRDKTREYYELVDKRNRKRR